MKIEFSRVRAAAALLSLLLLATGCAGGSAGGQNSGANGATADVNFIVDYLWGTKHAGFVVADKLGYYKEEGLNVTLNEGQGSSVASQLVANGDMDFGHIQSDVGVTGVAKGLGITTVMTIHPQSPQAIIYNKAKISNLSSLEDLNGHTLGSQEGSAGSIAWDAVVAITGADVSNVKIVNTGEQLLPSIREGQVDAILGFDYDQVSALQAMGMDVGYLMMSDLGRDVPGAGVVVNNKFAETNPKAVEGFVKATNRGWKYASENPDEALKIFMEAHPRADEEWEKHRLPMVLASIGPAEKIGAIERPRFENLIKQYHDLKLIKTQPAVDEVVNDSYIKRVLGE